MSTLRFFYFCVIQSITTQGVSALTDTAITSGGNAITSDTKVYIRREDVPNVFPMDGSFANVTLIRQLDEKGDIAVCPGEGDRYGDHKCNHDQTHRVCAQLLGTDGKPIDWGSHGDFWEITGQKAFQWDAEIRQNGGDSWCICMWATASLINKVGCENVHLRCDATDVAYVLKQYDDGGQDIGSAKSCLKQKCGQSLLLQLGEGEKKAMSSEHHGSEGELKGETEKEGTGFFDIWRA